MTRMSDERGAAATVVALALVVFLGCGALAVDLGDVWESRRHLVTATDAAALAAAASEAMGDSGCAGVDDDYVDANYDDATVTDCVVDGAGDTRGTVTVDASVPVETHFASVIGVDEVDVKASTTAAWFTPSGAYSLRPFGLCKDHPDVASWLASPDGSSAPVIVRYNKESPDACGDAPGNWGVFDFNGGANSEAELRQWVQDGYDKLVRLGDDVEGNTGALSTSVESVLDGLVVSGSRFALPIYDTVSGPGANATFNIYGFVGVELIDYVVTGAEQNRFLKLKFVEMVIAGQCCGTVPGTHAVRICAIDHYADKDNC